MLVYYLTYFTYTWRKYKVSSEHSLALGRICYFVVKLLSYVTSDLCLCNVYLKGDSEGNFVAYVIVMEQGKWNVRHNI